MDLFSHARGAAATPVPLPESSRSFLASEAGFSRRATESKLKALGTQPSNPNHGDVMSTKGTSKGTSSGKSGSSKSGGRPANAPSTTGRPSGRGRGNNPPKK